MDYRYNFGEKKKSHKKKIIGCIIAMIVVIVVVGFVFQNSSNGVMAKLSGVITYPFEKAYEFGSNLVRGYQTNLSDKKKTTQEKEALQNEMNALKLQLLESQKVLDENTSLKQMLDIKKAFQHFNIKMGRILYREHDNWTQTFKIDIGTEEGVMLNKAVVHQNGLVGYISAVEEHTSTVTTILDPSSSVSVSISTINEPAILKGDLNLKSSNKLNLSFIPLDAEVSMDDMLYTSGLSANYPASIPVGRIVEVIKSKNDMNRTAIVEPNVNIRTISEVGVIIN